MKKLVKNWLKMIKILILTENFPFLSQYSENFLPLFGGKLGRIYCPDNRGTNIEMTKKE